MKGYRLVLLSLSFLVWFCAPASAEVYQVIRYIRVDLGSGTTAHMYDENFQRFPDNPFDTRTSYESFEGRRVWLLSYEPHVVRRLADGTVEVMDENRAYAKLPHHMAIAYTGKLDPFLGSLLFQLPIGMNAELVNIELPAPYAYKIQGGFLAPFNWHWHNVSGVPSGDEVYLQFILTLDDEDNGYRDTNYSVVLTDETGAGEFCVNLGDNSYESFAYTVPQRLRPVLVIPHIHDHGYLIEMLYNDEVVLSFPHELVNDFSYHISHGGCQNVFWHRHDGHIRYVPQWTQEPGKDLILERGSRIKVRSYYDNPHTDAEGRGIRVDGMGVMTFYWEAVP